MYAIEPCRFNVAEEKKGLDFQNEGQFLALFGQFSSK